MKISKKILSLVLTVALVASINWTYVGELWSMISSAAMQMVSGHSVSTSALQHELETITLRKFLKIDIENLDDVLVDVLNDFLDEEVDSTEEDTTEEVVDDGDVKTINGYEVKVNVGQQNKHLPDTNEYKNALKNGQNKSIMYGDIDDIQNLLNKKAGKGDFLGKNKERVNFEQVIGQYVDPDTGIGIETTIGIIHYGKKGAHIVPARPN